MEHEGLDGHQLILSAFLPLEKKLVNSTKEHLLWPLTDIGNYYSR